ncbi:MAG: hypothetical protein EAY65_04705 [Alphaproteobacteria bacterium]|nr:MAG: hypothetical protein EAY65_04705 [Alphaproteobacteria bacterium]
MTNTCVMIEAMYDQLMIDLQEHVDFCESLVHSRKCYKNGDYVTASDIISDDVAFELILGKSDAKLFLPRLHLLAYTLNPHPCFGDPLGAARKGNSRNPILTSEELELLTSLERK